jgi:hypothetical protein
MKRKKNKHDEKCTNSGMGCMKTNNKATYEAIENAVSECKACKKPCSLKYLVTYAPFQVIGPEQM